MINILVQNWKNVLSLLHIWYTPVTKHTVPDLFNVCKNHNNIEITVDQNLKSNLQLRILTHQTVTLKHDQDNQTWYKLADPKQGYNNAQFEKPCLNSIREKANNKSFWSFSAENVQKSQIGVYIHDLFDVLNKPTKL